MASVTNSAWLLPLATVCAQVRSVALEVCVELAAPLAATASVPSHCSSATERIAAPVST